MKLVSCHGYISCRTKKKLHPKLKAAKEIKKKLRGKASTPVSRLPAILLQNLVECKLCYHVLFFLYLRFHHWKACKRCFTPKSSTYSAIGPSFLSIFIKNSSPSSQIKQVVFVWKCLTSCETFWRFGGKLEYSEKAYRQGNSRPTTTTEGKSRFPPKKKE